MWKKLEYPPWDYSNYGHVAFVGDFNGRYLEPVNGIIKCEKLIIFYPLLQIMP